MTNVLEKIKLLAYYQIIGGIIGIGLTILAIAQTGIVAGLIMVFFILATGLYSFSIYCGQQLLKGDTQKALKLSVINQAAQSIYFSISGFAYKIISGAAILFGVDYTDDFSFDFNISISLFQFNFNSTDTSLTAGFNLTALYLIYFISRLQSDAIQENSSLRTRRQ